jgi:hypothetical protein
MDRQLKDLKIQFEQIPIAFTENDKQAIRNKIDRLQQKPVKRRLHLYPKLLTGTVVAAAILLFIFTINQQSGFFMSDSVRSTDNSLQEKASDKKADMAQIESSDSGDANSISDSNTGPETFAREDSVTEAYQESIALTPELQGIYKEYKANLDDALLVGLSPFDVFKLYQYANLQDDLDVVYALYMKGDNYYVPDKDTYINEAEKDIPTNQQIEDNYNKLLEVESFTLVYLTEEEALVEYQLDHLIGFRLLKDTELDVWKVSWLPIQ